MPVSVRLLAEYLAFSCVLSLIPGPSVVMSTSRAIAHGRRRAMPIVLGSFAGGLGLIALVVAGLGAVVVTVAPVFTAIKWAGAVVLFGLGIRALLAARNHAGETSAADAADRPDHGFRRGLTVGVLNPKSIVSVTAVIPQFVDPGLGHVPLQLAIIGLSGGLMQLCVETIWVVAAGTLRGWFARGRRRLAALKGVGGLAMIGLSVRLAFERAT